MDPWDEEDEWAEPPVDAAEANRLVRRIAQLDRRKAEQDAIYAAERAVLDEWRERVTGTVTQERARLVDLLGGFALAVHEANGTKTWDLPAGTCRLRSTRRSLVVTDAQGLGVWADGEGLGWVEWVPKPKAQEITGAVSPGSPLGPPGDDGKVPHSAVTAHGEVVPGVLLMLPGAALALTVQPR